MCFVCTSTAYGQRCSVTDRSRSQVTRGPVRKRADGEFELTLSEAERHLLTHLLAQLEAALSNTQSAADPIFRRLFPVAHPNDPDLEASYQELVGNELVSLRRAKLQAVVATVAATRLDEPTLLAWMNVVNDLRLILGTRLDVSEDEDLEPYPSDHPEAEAYAIYGYLGYLLDSIVESIS